ncbi:hypothetical protein V7128_17680 [Neobacillus vireti]|uniref:hypothetical protein n=1 Tax=Neobacillus vireti TaxID=220686 RepID=UPI003000A912
MSGKIDYQLTHLAESRQILKQYRDFEIEKQPTVQEALEGFDVDVVIVNANGKRKETAEDFLNDIFG